MTVLIRDGDAWVERVFKAGQVAEGLVLPGFRVASPTWARPADRRWRRTRTPAEIDRRGLSVQPPHPASRRPAGRWRPASGSPRRSSRPSATRRARSSGRSSRSRRAAASASSLSGSKYQPAAPPISGRAVESARATGHALGHRLDGRDAEALAERGEDQGRRLGVGGAERPCPGDSRASGSRPARPAAAIASRSGRASVSDPVPSSTRASSPAATSGSRPPPGPAGPGSSAAGSWPPRAGRARPAAGPGRPRTAARSRAVGRLEEQVLGARWGRTPPGPGSRGTPPASCSVLNRETERIRSAWPKVRGQPLADLRAAGPAGPARRRGWSPRAGPAGSARRTRPGNRPSRPAPDHHSTGGQGRAATTAGASRVRTGSSRRGRAPSDSQ